MSSSLRVLILEDHPPDAELVVGELRRAGFDPDWLRVDTEAEYLSKLDSSWDLVLSDYTLPQFDALRALLHLQERGLEIPFIVITGGYEESAIACLKQGAADYLIKDRLARLGEAVRQALEEKKLRQEKHQAEAALRESEKRFRSVAETAIDAIVITDSMGNIQYWNHAAERTFGLQGSEAIGRPLGELVRRPRPGGNRADGLTIAGETDVVGRAVELIGIGKAGQEFPVELSLTEWQAEGQRYFSAIIRDMTQALKAQQRAQQQDRLASLGQLAAGIAHDFNHVLASIILYSEMVLSSLELSDKDEERLRTILKQAERGAYLTRRILDFSRRAIVELRPVDLVPFLVEFEKLLGPSLKRNVQARFSFEREHHIISADPNRMQQVFMNLALNAQDAMPSGGDLRFEVHSIRTGPGDPPPIHDMTPGEWERIRVKDTGTGISAEDIPHIFDPFFTTKPPGEGTGLGLAQVFGIVSQHGGQITVSSQQGKGTEFTIYLPASSASMTQDPGALRPQHLKASGETVLVVDDDEPTRQAIGQTLKSLGYRILLTADGKEALQMIEHKAKHVDVVLTDLVMPTIGGVELFDRLKERYPDLPLVLMTGYPLGMDIHQVLDRESVTWLEKPLNTGTLARALRQVLDRNKLRLSEQVP